MVVELIDSNSLHFVGVFRVKRYFLFLFVRFGFYDRGRYDFVSGSKKGEVPIEAEGRGLL
jgi:hypothetical protein